MKSLFRWIVLLLPVVGHAQWVVHDPTNYVVNATIQTNQQANHIEVLRQWAEQLERLNRQIRHLEDQLTVQRRIADVIGNPTAAGVAIVLRDLGATDLSRSYGETLRAIQRISNAVDSLRRTSERIYRALDDRTVLGREFPRQTAPYQRYAAVEQAADNFEAVSAETDTRSAALQTDLADTLVKLREAPTQAEVDKLAVKVAAVNGQLAHLAAQKRTAAEQLHAQQILNANQAEKERQDLLEKQIAEERQSLAVVNAWQTSIRLTADSYTRP